MRVCPLINAFQMVLRCRAMANLKSMGDYLRCLHKTLSISAAQPCKIGITLPMSAPTREGLKKFERSSVLL